MGDRLAYVSYESGRGEVYVGRTDDPAERLLVSVEGGTAPIWSADGERLFYRHGYGIWEVTFGGAEKLQVQNREHLFSEDYEESYLESSNWDVGRDGRFLLVRSKDPLKRNMIYVTGWTHGYRFSEEIMYAVIDSARWLIRGVAKCYGT
jgi:hypothetical protein